jgi:hypothetical protein
MMRPPLLRSMVLLCSHRKNWVIRLITTTFFLSIENNILYNIFILL